MKKDFPFKVYDPTPEAKALLEKYTPFTAVCGLLNQLGACRQTVQIDTEFNATIRNSEINNLITAIHALHAVIEEMKAGVTTQNAEWNDCIMMAMEAIDQVRQVYPSLQEELPSPDKQKEV